MNSIWNPFLSLRKENGLKPSLNKLEMCVCVTGHCDSTSYYKMSLLHWPSERIARFV